MGHVSSCQQLSTEWKGSGLAAKGSPKGRGYTERLANNFVVMLHLPKPDLSLGNEGQLLLCQETHQGSRAWRPGWSSFRSLELRRTSPIPPPPAVIPPPLSHTGPGSCSNDVSHPFVRFSAPGVERHPAPSDRTDGSRAVWFPHILGLNPRRLDGESHACFNADWAM